MTNNFANYRCDELREIGSFLFLLKIIVATANSQNTCALLPLNLNSKNRFR